MIIGSYNSDTHVQLSLNSNPCMTMILEMSIWSHWNPSLSLPKGTLCGAEKNSDAGRTLSATALSERVFI